MPRIHFVSSLTGVAWFNVIVHLAALGLAGVWMRPGSPLVPLAERLDYLARAEPGWMVCWTVWMLCAVALITFLAMVAHRLRDHTGLAQLGFTSAVAGAAFDLYCDSVYILVFPMLASWQPRSEALFLAVERLTGIASLFIANGAYSLGVLFFTLALRGRKGVSPRTIVAGWANAGFGLLLAAAAFTGVPWHAEWLTPPTIGLFCLWAVLVARSLEPAGEPT